MKPNFIISNEERERILNLHESATKRQYLSEETITNYDNKYDYKKEGDEYYFKLKGSDSWTTASGNALEAIKSKVFKVQTKRGGGQEVKPNMTNSPFKTKNEGDNFRKWVNDNYPEIANKIKLDKTGSHNNSFIINAWNYNTKGGKLGELYKKKKPKSNENTEDILVSDTLVKRKIVFDPRRETTPFTCSETGCAEWVSNQLSELGMVRQGNAWHAHNVNQNKLKYTPFMNLNPNTQKQMAKLFTEINKNPKEKSKESSVRALVQSLMPDQDSLREKLKVNDVVGLYWDGSDNFTKAFFEGATGYLGMGTNGKATDGPYFISKDGKPWSPDNLKKDITFIPGNSLKNGSGFGLNTHLGYVGAIVKGEPIIFHNVHQTVHATPLSQMGKTKVLWVKEGVGNVVNPKKEAPSWWDSFKYLT